MTENDAVLLRRYADEHAEDAFAELVRRHIDGVYSSALRRVGGDQHLAEDVTQHVFTALARGARNLAEHPALCAWLYVTTRNESANVVRRERRRRAREQEAYAMSEHATGDQHTPDWARLAPLLDGAIDTLGDADRTAVVLRFIEKRSYADIGAVLRVSEDAARMRVDRALDKLRGHLGRVGVTSTAAALSTALAGSIATAAPAGLAQSVTAAALSAGAASVGGVAAVIQFMSTTKVIAGVVGVIAVVAIGTATREVMAMREADAAVATAAEQNRAAAEDQRRAQERVAAAEREAAQLRESLAGAQAERDEAERRRKAAAPAGGGGGGSQKNDELRARGRAYVARHPEVKQAVLEYHHALIASLFGPFFKQHQFTDAQIAQFEQAMMGGMGAFRMVADENGQMIPISTPTFGDLEKRREEDRLLGSLLGRDGVQDLRAYMPQVSARNVVNQIKGDFYAFGAPLTAEQGEAIVQALSTGGSSRGADGQPNWPAIIGDLQQVLTPSQLAVLNGIQAQRAYNRALQEAMSKAANGAANPKK